MLFFFFNDTATTEIYTLSLHDALPIYRHRDVVELRRVGHGRTSTFPGSFPAAQRSIASSSRSRGTSSGSTSASTGSRPDRSEEHTSELQSRQYLVCRLLLEKKNKQKNI